MGDKVFQIVWYSDHSNEKQSIMTKSKNPLGGNIDGKIIKQETTFKYLVID